MKYNPTLHFKKLFPKIVCEQYWVTFKGFSQARKVGVQRGPCPSGSKFLNFFTNYIHYFCSCPHFKTFGPLQLATFQLKNLTTITRYSQCWLYFSKKIFYHQRTKKPCVIGKVKAKFFTTTVNWYKYQLIVVSC